MDTSHTGVSGIHSDTKSNFPNSPPSDAIQVERSSLVSQNGSVPDSDRLPVTLVKISGTNSQEAKVKSSFGSNMSTEDMLRRLHRHPSISTVKREMIEFEKGSSRMGIEIVAGDKTPHRGALVIRVFPDCIAGLEGKLSCGDEILEIGGKSIIGMPHSEVISLLKESTGLVTMLVSRSSQVLNYHSGSETSLLDDFYTTERLKSANSSSTQSNLDDQKSSNGSLHSVKHEDFSSEDELDDASPAGLIQQRSQSEGLNDNVITIQYSDSSIFSTGYRTSAIFEVGNLPPLPLTSPPIHEDLSSASPIPSHRINKEMVLPLKEIETNGPPVGYSALTLEIQKVSKGKLTIVPCQKIQEGYFMVSWLMQYVGYITHYNCMMFTGKAICSRKFQGRKHQARRYLSLTKWITSTWNTTCSSTAELERSSQTKQT